MVLITGASRGIGKYLFEQFDKDGADVFGTYFSEEENYKDNDRYFKLDVRNFDQAQTIMDDLGNKITNFILLNCAGNNYTSFAHKSSPEKWNDVIDTNLTGTYNVIRAALPVMREKGFGRIINFSSIVAEVGIPGTSAYAASKAGLWGLTRSIAVENASKGITINNLNLGYFNVGMISELTEEFSNKVKEKIPSGEFGDPKNIFNAVKFIIKSDYLNGTSIDINGAIY